MTRLFALFFVLTLVACSSGGSPGQNMISPAQIRPASSNNLTIVHDFPAFAEAYEPCCPPQNGCFAYLPSDKNVYHGTLNVSLHGLHILPNGWFSDRLHAALGAYGLCD
jgi:hypothetical protein